MKRKLQITGIFIISFFMAAPAVFSQTNMQTRMNSDSTYSDMNDTSEYHSMSYYNYAKKNIIEDKTPAKEYQGKWVDSSKTETSKSKEEMNESGNSMNNENMNNEERKTDKNMNQKMDEMKNDTKEKANDIKNDAQKKVDDMNNNGQNK